MQVLNSLEKLNEWKEQQKGQKVVFVPTMGFLHEGHLSLVRAGKKVGGSVIVSIYVNPKQFGDAEDFEKYPRDAARDLRLLESVGVDAVFLPDDEVVYGDLLGMEDFDLSIDENLIDKMCGQFRPGHFEGVAEVVMRLFALVQPDVAVFGLKDFQQCKVIEFVVEKNSLPIQLVFCETVRDAAGLALSSRNERLSDGEKMRARALGCALFDAGEVVREFGVSGGDRGMGSDLKHLDVINSIKQAFAESIVSAGLKLEYFEIVWADDLSTLKMIKFPLVLAAAVYCGKVRLIDNICIDLCRRKKNLKEKK